jgi:hypothetical protein
MVNRLGAREETVKKDVKEALWGAREFVRNRQTSRASIGGVQVAVDFRRCAGGK